jgi:hypothetical protein
MEKLLKTYSKNYSSLRRKWADLYRPMKKIEFLHPIVIIMFFLFGLSALGFAFNIPYDFLPFLIGFIFVAISFLYFKLFPLTWSEMYDYEKKYYRELFRLPIDWNPQSK